MSRDMTLTFTVGESVFSIATFGGVLSDMAYTPPQPIQRFVEIPGRSQPLDISRAATGTMTYTHAVYTYVVSFIGYDGFNMNDRYAKLFVEDINGKICDVNGPYDNDYTAEVAVTNYEALGEFVRITIECTVM